MAREIGPGAELAGYRIVSVIGRGGMGVVYLADHLRLKRRVALKVLAPELASDERFRDRFVQESELAASLEHPNIVPIYDAGEAEGLLFIAMRLVDGIDLQALVERDGPMEPQRASAIVSQLASALDAAHAAGLVHRDVKPANVLVATGPAGAETAYLTDFGLTKRPDQTTGLTRTGQFMGSVDYAAPEQFEGNPLDPRTDVYSLAGVAYWTLTGQAPFPRDREAAVMFAHLQSPVPRASAARSDLPTSIDPVIARGMSKRPDDRYPSAGAFADAFRTALPGQETRPSEPPAAQRRRRLAVGGSIAAAIVVVAVLVAVWLRGPEPSSGSNGRPTGSPSASASAGSPPPAGTIGVVRLDPASGDLTPIPIDLPIADVPFDRAIASGGGFVWVYDAQNEELLKISPTQNTVIDRRPFPGGAGVAVGDGSVWIMPDFFAANAQLRRISPQTNSVTETVTVREGRDCCQLTAYGEGSVWGVAGTLVQVDPATNKLVRQVKLQGTQVVPADGKAWVLDVLGELIPVDVATGDEGAAVPLPGANPVAIAVTPDAIWAADRGEESGATVSRIPLGGGGGIEEATVGVRPNAMAVDPTDGAIWVACYGDGTVWKIDPVTLETTRFPVGGHPAQIVADADGVWIVSEPPSDAYGSPSP